MAFMLYGHEQYDSPHFSRQTFGSQTTLRQAAHHTRLADGFSFTRPPLKPQDQLSLNTNWNPSRLTAGSFRGHLAARNTDLVRGITLSFCHSEMSNSTAVALGLHLIIKHVIERSASMRPPLLQRKH